MMNRKALLIFSITLFFVMGIEAQTSNQKFTLNMKTLIQEANSIGTNYDEFVVIGSKFERIGNVETKEWLPYYYAAYCYSMKALRTSKESENLANKADKLLDMALQRGGNRCEILCLKSYAATARLLLDPQHNWMTEGKKSSEYINQAIESEPNNPRACLLLGQSILNTPKEYGGGYDAAKNILEKALEKFKAFKAPNELYPNWGEQYARYLLTQKKSY